MLSLVFLFSIVSCSDDSNDNLDCIGACLFTKIDATGVISYTDCYQQWSITFDEDELHAIIIDPDNDLKVEGLRVEVSGLLYENDFPFLWPDPPGPIQHKIEISNYQILD